MCIKIVCMIGATTTYNVNVKTIYDLDWNFSAMEVELNMKNEFKK